MEICGTDSLSILKTRGASTIKLSLVKGHATEEYIQNHHVRQLARQPAAADAKADDLATAARTDNCGDEVHFLL